MKTVNLIIDEKVDSNYFIREAFNTLRTNVLFSGRDVQVIVVTSCFAHEGKTSISMDLCRSLAEAGKRVLLVDADLRKSVMAGRYTAENGVVGLSQILSGQVESKDAIYHTDTENMDIIFSGPYPPNPAELVGSPAFRELMDEQRKNYNYVIIDAPPLGLVVDASIMSTGCDGGILVIDMGRVKYRMAQKVKQQLEKSGCKILGVVLNQISRRASVRASRDSAYSNAYGGSRYGSESYYGHEDLNKPSAQAKPQAPKAAPASQPMPAVRPVNAARPAAPAARPAPATRPAPTTRPVQRPASKPENK